MRKLLTIYISVCLVQIVSAREIITQKFQNFEYEQVIELVNDELAKNQCTAQDSVRFLEMQAVSYYSLTDMSNAFSTFVKILSINPDFELDPAQTSPKIVSFFSDIKNGYEKPQPVQQQPTVITKIDTVVKVVDYTRDLTGALSRSLVLPGWGHYYQKPSTKSYVLMSASLLTLSSIVYSAYDCHQKQDAYLSETKISRINDLYHDYNRAYKIRNAYIAAYACLWIWTQADILFFEKPILGDSVSLYTRGSQVGFAVNF